MPSSHRRRNVEEREAQDGRPDAGTDRRIRRQISGAGMFSAVNNENNDCTAAGRVRRRVKEVSSSPDVLAFGA